MADTLPEGTDHIIPGASINARDTDESSDSPSAANVEADAPDSETDETGAGFNREKLKSEANDFREKASAKAADLRSQATDKAREYADQGKVRASEGLDSIAKLIGENAGQLDEKLGPVYGDYVRKAGDAVSGFSATLRDKDVEELIVDARDLVRRSPAIAIGAAAAAGFFISRLIKAGSEVLDETAKSTGAKPSQGSSETGPTADAGSNDEGKKQGKRKSRTPAS